MSFNDWILPNSKIIKLITQQQLQDLPLGTVLYSISGERCVVGVDYIDGDTRAGFLAYGVPTWMETPEVITTDKKVTNVSFYPDDVGELDFLDV